MPMAFSGKAPDNHIGYGEEKVDLIGQIDDVLQSNTS
jgi:hypothetical protein